MTSEPTKDGARVKLLALSESYDQQLAGINAELAELERMAAASGKRRGDRRPGGNDTQKYRLGSIFAVLDHNFEMLDDLALLGLISQASDALRLLAQFRCESDRTLMDPISRILKHPDHFPILRQRGAALRWEWNFELYQEEVAAFAQSKSARNPNAAWRRKSPTRRQIYLIGEVVRCFRVSPPALCTRGEAYEWLREHGGNPRFANPPVKKEGNNEQN